jgi:N-acetylmuramic acid 6-phosphate etherase
MRILAFDGGGSTTRAGLYDASRRLLAEAKGGPSNPVAYGTDVCLDRMASLSRALLGPGQEDFVVVAGVSGAGMGERAERIADLLSERLQAARVVLSNDIRAQLYANARDGDGVLVVSGTGSSVAAQSRSGEYVMVGGRGPTLGDDGSAYQIAARGLRAAAHALDGMGPQTRLVETMAAAAGVADFPALNVKLFAAAKEDVARLAPAVAETAVAGDAAAQSIIESEAHLLALQTVAVFDRLALPHTAPVFLQGGVFEHCPSFSRIYELSLHRLRPGIRSMRPRYTGHRAVLELAFAAELPKGVYLAASRRSGAARPSQTEQPAAGVALERMTPLEIVTAMNRADTAIADAVASQKEAIAEAVAAIADGFRDGGRLIYIGAGTSGRLGVLDASECPPTFGVPPGRVIGIMAGGDRALRESVEDAEDVEALAVADLQKLIPPLESRDIVVGISASGTTAYVRAGLNEAQQRGAKTVLLCCNPAPRDAAGIVIAVQTGPEVVAGSTRLKAGTATKIVLNMLSTGAMALCGYTLDGYMVGVQPTNEKLRARAVRIIEALTSVDATAASVLLDAAGNNVAAAVLMARRSIDAASAGKMLAEAKGNVRMALDSS